LIKQWFKNMYNKFMDDIAYEHTQRRRKEKIIEECGCVCYCPNCKDLLNDQATCEENDFVVYLCNECGYTSIWSFDLAPVPIMMSFHKEEDQ